VACYQRNENTHSFSFLGSAAPEDERTPVALTRGPLRQLPEASHCKSRFFSYADGKLLWAMPLNLP
jgi:hypothetical protein